jgi:hypothetical protein
LADIRSGKNEQMIHGGGEMKRGVRTLLVVLILALPVTVMGAHRTRGIVTVWTGTYVQDDPSQNLTGKCPPTGCVGDMVTCKPSETMTITKQIFSFVARTCDDTTDERAPCDGEITGLVEECTAPGDAVKAGPLTASNSTGAVRYCVGSGDCTGADPEQVVGEGTTVTQTRFAAGAPTGSELSTVRGQYKKFRFGGKRVIFYIAHTYYNLATLEPNDGSNCGDGCGIAGVGITDRR